MYLSAVTFFKWDVYCSAGFGTSPTSAVGKAVATRTGRTEFTEKCWYLQMEKWWVKERIRKVRVAKWAALLMCCRKTVIWSVPWTQCHSKWEMPAVLDVLRGWVGFSSLFKLLMKLGNLSPLFLKVFVVSVWGRNGSGILCKWYAVCAWCNSAVHDRGVFIDDWGSNYRESIFV